MKKLLKPRKFKPDLIFPVLLLLLFRVSSEYASAQLNTVIKLTESDMSTLFPILKAETAGFTKTFNAIASSSDRRYQLFLDIKSGKTDPLEWLKQHSKHFIVPPEAKYEPACSRAVSLGSFAMMSDQELAEAKLMVSAIPTAIFSLGREIRTLSGLPAAANATQESYENIMQKLGSLTEQDYADIKAVMDKAIAFYTRNGFKAGYDILEDGPSRTTAHFSHPEEDGLISGKIYHFDPGLFNPYYPETVKQCRQHIAGPSIEIKAEFSLLDKVFSSGGEINLDENTRNSLKKAGISEERYNLFKASLMKARIDSEYPDGIEVPEIDFTPTTAEEKEDAKIIAAMKEDALARKSNVAFYLKHKTELDPVVEILLKYTGGQQY